MVFKSIFVRGRTVEIFRRQRANSSVPRLHFHSCSSPFSPISYGLLPEVVVASLICVAEAPGIVCVASGAMVSSSLVGDIPPLISWILVLLL